jgi:hypothetical protein
VDAHDLLARHGKHPERIVVAQVGLGGERELGEVGERFEIARRDSRRVELPPVVRYVLISVRKRPRKRSSCSAASSFGFAVSIFSSSPAAGRLTGILVLPRFTGPRSRDP